MSDFEQNEKIAALAKKNEIWYLAKIPTEIDPARHLLEKYSGVAPEVIDAHIYQIVRSQLVI